MEIVDYAPLLQTQPPEGTVEWLISEGVFETDYMIYRAEMYTDQLTGNRIKGVRVTCSGCGESRLEPYVAGNCCASYSTAPFGYHCSTSDEDVISGRETTCPNCGRTVQARHIGDYRCTITTERYCTTVGRIDNKLVLYGWLVQRVIDKGARTAYVAHPYEAYVIEDKSIKRLNAYNKYITTIKLLDTWVQRKNYADNWGTTGWILPWDRHILDGSTADNSKLDAYLRIAGDDALPVTWIRLWQKHPAVENLITQGAGNLISKLIYAECKRYSYERPKGCPQLPEIDWHQKRPAQMLGLNKVEFKYCVAQKWTADDLRIYKRLRSAEQVKLPDDMTTVMASGGTLGRLLDDDITKLRGKISVMRCLRYLARQNENKKPKVNAYYLVDYWNMVQQCGRVLSDASVILPRNLRREHDKAESEMQRIRDAEEMTRRAAAMEKRKPGFAAQAERLAPYAWERDGICIRSVKDETELIAEGKWLHHCVATYADRVAAGNTSIFVVRRASEPDMPWYTLQLDTKTLTVLQNRGKKNCDRTPEVQAFERSWLKWLRAERAAGRLDRIITKGDNVA